MANIKSIPPQQEGRIIARVSALTILGNILLTVFKLFAGIAGHSGAMVSDAIHSMSDVAATAITYFGIRLSRKDADQQHPYGHERVECLVSLLLGLLLFMVGCGIGWEGILKIAGGSYDQLTVPSTLALAAAIVSILTKEAMYWYTRHYALLLNSTAFMADAWHHRSDALSSVGSLIGIGGANPAASIAICLCILKVAFDILKDAVKKMLDTSCDPEYEETLSNFISAQPGVIRLDSLRTRMFGSRVYVDLEIAVEGEKPLREAHSIAEQVHDGVEAQFPNVKHIMIHVNPA